MRKKQNGKPPRVRKGEKEMIQHYYRFELRYKKMVKGEASEFIVPITAIDVCYVDACSRVDDHVRKNFGDLNISDATIHYIGEFIDGVLKKVVGDEKEDEEMRTKKKSYEVMEMENGFLGRYVEQLKKSIDGWIEMNNAKDNEINRLEKRVKEFEEKQKEMKAEYNGGYFDVRNINPNSCYNISLIPRGSGKHKVAEELWKSELDARIRYCDDDFNILKRACEMIAKQQAHVIDVNRLYPSSEKLAEKVVYKRAIDVCEVYRKERDAVMKENESLKAERIKKRDMYNDMFKKADKYEDKFLGVLKQAKLQKEKLKEKDDVISDLLEQIYESRKLRKEMMQRISELTKNHEISVKEIQCLNREKQELISELNFKPLNDMMNNVECEQIARLVKQLETSKELNRILRKENKQLWKEKKG